MEHCAKIGSCEGFEDWEIDWSYVCMLSCILLLWWEGLGIGGGKCWTNHDFGNKRAIPNKLPSKVWILWWSGRLVNLGNLGAWLWHLAGQTILFFKPLTMWNLRAYLGREHKSSPQSSLHANSCMIMNDCCCLSFSCQTCHPFGQLLWVVPFKFCCCMSLVSWLPCATY